MCFLIFHVEKYRNDDHPYPGCKEKIQAFTLSDHFESFVGLLYLTNPIKGGRFYKF